MVKIARRSDGTDPWPPRLRPEDVRELLELVARSLRPIYPLETDCGFDELLNTLDRHGL